MALTEIDIKLSSSSEQQFKFQEKWLGTMQKYIHNISPAGEKNFS
jgi:hypothetical protein